jgi:hypothetical protein
MINLANQRFTRLTVLRPKKERYCGGVVWLCQCDCGQKISVTSNHLRTGHTQSCGCLRVEALAFNRLKQDNLVHGHAGRNQMTRAYRIWSGMLQRCTNANNKAFKWYGGRGITVCDDWLKFENFLADMGEPPEGRSIDRIDNDGNYEPDNCRWATRMEQSASQRRRGEAMIG